MKLLLSGALSLALLVPAVAAPHAATPIAVPASANAQVTQLFERAAKVYGQANAVKMQYSTAVKTGDDTITLRGLLVYEAPARFRFEHTILGDKTVFVYDGYTLTMQSANEKPRRVVVKPNQTVWDALPDASLPDPLIDSFLAGENPIGDFAGAAKLETLAPQIIDGAICDAARIAADEVTITAYFNRTTGALQRVTTVTGDATLDSTYSKIEIDPVLAPDTFVLNGAQSKNTGL